MTEMQPTPGRPFEGGPEPRFGAVAPPGGSSAGGTSAAPGAEGEAASEQVHNVGKLLRVGGMLREMLDESRRDSLDADARRRAEALLARCIEELKGAVSPDLGTELDRINLPFAGEVPSQSELRLTQAQLVGWFEGLFHGMQATLMGQQMGGQVPHPLRRQGPAQPDARPGQYL
ncbi:MAG TPA: proteasome activator [Actinomycetota bacterium]|nr:proteasome activator [Actinomycetota bacterium]